MNTSLSQNNENVNMNLIRESLPVSVYDIDGEGQQTINARDIHAFMGVARNFATWITPLIEKYGYVEGQDYLQIKKHENVLSKKPQTDYHFRLDVAKEIAMVQNNDKGRAIRQYFIAVEKEFRKAKAKPMLTEREVVLGYLAKIDECERLTAQNNVLNIENHSLQMTIDCQKPAIDYANKVLDSKGIMPATCIAEKLKISTQALNKFLKKQGVIRMMNGSWIFTSKYLNMGYGRTVSHVHINREGIEVSTDLLKWTEKGRRFAIELWESVNGKVTY